MGALPVSKVGNRVATTTIAVQMTVEEFGYSKRVDSLEIAKSIAEKRCGF